MATTQIPPRLTDSTGGAASSTLAAATNTDALADNGGGTADGTVAAMTAPGALTVTDGTGTNDGTIGAITADASVIAAIQELAAKHNTANTLFGTIKDNIKELTTELALQRSLNTVLINAAASLAARVNTLIDAIR